MGSEAEAEKRLCFFSKKYASDFAPLLGKTLKLGKIEGRRRRGQQKMRFLMMRWLDGITDSMDLSMSKLHQMEKDRAVWYAAVRWVARGQTQLSD